MDHQTAEAILDWLKALWQLLQSVFMWLQTVPEELSKGLSHLSGEVRLWGCLIITAAILHGLWTGRNRS